MPQYDLFNTTFYSSLNTTCRDYTPEDVADSIPYPSAPIYFTLSEADSTSEQLAEFIQSPLFETFFQQYSTLLLRLNTWCNTHNITVNFNEVNEDNSVETFPAFLYFYHRLFNLDFDYYSTRKAILFGEGKKSLEQLWLLLQDPALSLDTKKNCLRTLQQSLDVCADGVQTQILDAYDELKMHFGIFPFLNGITKALLRQLAVEFIRAQLGEEKDNEIHYVNAAYNSVARYFNLPLVEDNFIDSLIFPARFFPMFATKIQHEFTVTKVIGNSIIQLTDKLEHFAQQLKELDEASLQNSQPTVERFVDEWNAKYIGLCPLHIGLFLEAERSNKLLLTPLNSAQIAATIIRHFKQSFVHNPSLPFRYQTQNIIVVCENTFAWVEEGGSVQPFTAEYAKLLVQIDPQIGFNAFFNLIRQGCVEPLALCLSFLTPEQVSFCFSPQEHIPGGLLALGEYALLHRLFVAQLVETKLLTLPVGDDRETLLLQLAKKNQLETIMFILHQRTLSKHHLELMPLDTILHLSNFYRMAPAIEAFIDQDLVNLRHFSFRNGANVNATFNLIQYSNTPILLKLIQNRLLVTEQLDAKNRSRGANCVNLAASNLMWAFLRSLVEHRLLTPFLLSDPDHQGVNAIWWIVHFKNWELLGILLDSGLISVTSLAAKDQRTASNVLLKLVFNHCEQLLITFANKLLIHRSLLVEENNRGECVLFTLARQRKFDVLCFLVRNGFVDHARLMKVNPYYGRSMMDYIKSAPHALTQGLFAALIEQHLLEFKQEPERLSTHPMRLFSTPTASEQQYRRPFLLNPNAVPFQAHNTNTF